MTSVLLSWLLLGATPQRLTLDQAGSAETLVKAVAEQTGRKLTVGTGLRHHMLYLHVKDAPVDELMAHCASALRATWITSGSESKLERTAAQSRTLLQEEREEVGRQIAEFLKQQHDVTVNTPEPRAKAAAFIQWLLHSEKIGAPRFDGPPEGLLADLLRGLGVEKLAEIAPYEIALFSNRPTSAERPLPGSAGEAIQRFGQVQDAIVAQMPEDMAREKFGAYTAMRIFNAERVQTAIGRVLVSVYRTDDRFFANLAVYNAEGGIGAEAALSIPFSSSLRDDDKEAIATPIELTPDGEKVVEEFTATFSSRVADEVRKVLRSPDEFDPLEIQVVPAFRALMREQGGNGAFVLPDRLVKATLDEPPGTTRDFQRILRRLDMETKSEGGWTTCTLPAWLQSSRHYMDRDALRTWLRAMTGANGDPLRATARLYAQCEDTVSASDLSRGYGEKVLAILGAGLLPSSIPRWLLFVLGTLTDREWTALMAGEPISVATPPKRAYWAREFSHSSFQILERRTQLAPVADMLLTGSAAFPSEIPREATLRLERGEMWAVWGTPLSTKGVDLESLSEWAASQAHSSGDEEIERILSGKYHLASEGFFTLRLAWNDLLQTTAHQDSGTTSLSGVPAEFQKWPREVRERFRESFAKNVAERAKTQAPPP